ncbi:SDR family oxidoreductase [Polynucleobacter sp. 86C-FISCH]|uniref:dTDP-4-dehydrorhamnose reductase family protein n=1 Tax=Polynucleobacter sp. 86C-FISCH TaxID=2689101 RepID=UPI001C0D74D9|nr:SDR family oxidoreductase [Polynucleobacter sp. 86C-FISCH]MBU3596016.1 SDR family oxidoreductase [Polynucleobacter sp. 86C-FISCH]
MKILVLGASGMLGHTLFHQLGISNSNWKIYGTIRSESSCKDFDKAVRKNLISGVNVENIDSLIHVFNLVKPEVVINCVGLVKQLSEASDPLQALPINSLLPHRLANLCNLIGSKLIHISTDCVFSGEKGNYLETDFSDAKDLYGKSKFLGELSYPHTVTLRTSIIGHELRSANGLVDWFLMQKKVCHGFTRAIFSGVPTIVLAEIIANVVIPNIHLLSGLYQIASKPISKYDLLCLIAEVYQMEIQVIPDDRLIIDRSLCSKRFTEATGYVAPEWVDMVEKMHAFRIANKNV